VMCIPAVIMHGAKDKMSPCAHGEWLAARCPAAESRIVLGAGHITVLDSARVRALDRVTTPHLTERLRRYGSGLSAPLKDPP
jgi:pimeloyl-ACP methyl ester carboxylesterase